MRKAASVLVLVACIALPCVSRGQAEHPISPGMLRLARQDIALFGSKSATQFVVDHGVEDGTVQRQIDRTERLMGELAGREHPSSRYYFADQRIGVLLLLARTWSFEEFSAMYHDDDARDREREDRYVACGGIATASLSAGQFIAWKYNDAQCLDLPDDASMDRVLESGLGIVRSELAGDRAKQDDYLKEHPHR